MKTLFTPILFLFCILTGYASDLPQDCSVKVIVVGNTLLCNGQTTSLTVVAAGGASPYTYQWRLDNTILSETRNTLSVNKGGVYSVRVTDSNGCQTTTNFSVTIQKPISLYIIQDGSLSFCADKGVVIKMPTVSMIPNSTIHWTVNGNPINGLAGIGDTIVIRTAGIYRAHVQAGCLDTTVTFPVTVWPLPKVSIVSSSSATCSNSTVSLNSKVAEGSGGYTYQWLKNGQVIAYGPTLSVSDSSIYQSKVQDNYGCIGLSAPYKLNIANLVVGISPLAEFCHNAGTLIAKVGKGNPPYIYQWQEGATKIGYNNDTLFVSKSGDYSVSVTDANGCRATSSFTVKDLGGVSAFITPVGSLSVYAPKTVLLQANVGPNLSYHWQRNSVMIAGATQYSFEAKESGNYTVIVSRSDGCSSSSAPVLVTIYPVLASEPVNSPPATVILGQNVPNPVRNRTAIEFGLPKRMYLKISMLSANGEVMSVLAEGIYGEGWHKLLVELPNMPSGVYFYKLQTEQGQQTKRLTLSQ